MRLKASIKLKCGVLDYAFTFANGSEYHSVRIAQGCSNSVRHSVHGTPGEAINELVPYRDDNPEVADLIRWLSRFPHDA
ncbi:hypothetical protein J4U00_gp085 [Mycobacterium phage DyoEdafos]|uniref:Uncharacterized protein n=1 Tax=Mycobacterium phage DyoEdafos TaxID=2599860 RepID=A0A5J6TH64_9CAUD|nr:hypothetical protein J4U00_gp085 [Mycobacterium phage DyoEdafos]QFG10313.1 hypothetical protein SEA_DYOEDAFOS_85 [Mycobacterium phage DyoEdafos]